MRSLLSVSFVRRPLLAGHGDNVTKRVRYVSILLWFPWPLCACVCVCALVFCLLLLAERDSPN